MYQRELGLGGRREDLDESSQDPRIERTPVGIDGVVPIASPVRISDVEVGNSVRVHRGACGPCCDGAEHKCDQGSSDAEGCSRVAGSMQDIRIRIALSMS